MPPLQGAHRQLSACRLQRARTTAHLYMSVKHALPTPCELRGHRPNSQCGPDLDELWARSYPVPHRWPFPPWRLVMEQRPMFCDLFRKRQFCCDFARGQPEYAIERFVPEAIASVLAGCHGRPCRAVDVGSNVGWMSGLMLALGAHTISVEPQADLAAALRHTARLNCWSPRSSVLNAFACADAAFGGTHCLQEERSPAAQFRSGGGVPLAAAAVKVRGVSLESVLYHGVSNAAAPLHIDLVKLDGDGPERHWLQTIALLLAKRPLLSIDAISVEHQIRGAKVTNVMAEVVQKLAEEFGFDVFRLAMQDRRRQTTATGWDAFSPTGTYGQLGRVRGTLPRDALEEEWLSARALRWLFRARRNLTTREWRTFLSPVEPRKYPAMELLLVHRRVPLLERDPVGFWELQSPEAMAAGYNASAAYTYL